MTYLEDKYINPFTDYGFKKLFGEEPNKDLLMDFLNELLKEQEGKIVELTYLKNEHLGNSDLDRKAIFDLYCENEKGEKFIVELQKSKQKFFKNRTLYYATFPIQNQGKKNLWDFQLKAVYTIAILDFVFDEDKLDVDKYRYDVKLTDIDTHKVFYDKLTFIYLEMPKFNKTADQLETRFDKWLYVIKNLGRLDKIPAPLKEKIFNKVFKAAEIANFTPEQVQSYEDSLKYFRDIKNSFDTAYEDGRDFGIEEGLKQGIEQGIEKGMEQGMEQGMDIGLKKTLEVIQLLKLNVSLSEIIKKTNLSMNEIQQIKNEL